MDYPKTVPGVGLVANKFSDGDVAQGIPASLDPAAWANSVTDELLNVISGFGLAPDEAKFDQLYKAIAGRAGTSGGLSFRNLLINAAGTINQRGYVSGAATTVANQYTLDRWRVVVSGQSLSWVANGAVMTMTAPAGGVEQVIEGLKILGGTYVLNWTGSATATVNGVAVLKGGTFTLPASTDAKLKFIGGTFSMPQVELGSVPTAFEFCDPAIEMLRCKRFTHYVPLSNRGYRTLTSAGQWGNDDRFPVRMRLAPAAKYTNGSGAVGIYFDGAINAVLAITAAAGVEGCWVQAVATPVVSGCAASYDVLFDAEIYT